MNEHMDLTRGRMNSLELRNVLGHIFFALFIVVFATEVDKLVFRAGWVSIPGGAIVVYVTIFAAIVAAALMSGTELTNLQNQARAKLRDNQLFLSVFLGLIVVGIAYWLVDTSADSLGLIDMFKALLVCVGAMLLPILSPYIKRYWRTYLGIAFAVYCLSIWIDALWPGTFTDLAGIDDLVVEGRISGLNLDSNSSSYIVAFLTVPLLSFRKFSPISLVVLSVTSLTILLTLSKSGMLILLLLVAAYFVLIIVKSHEKRPFVAGAFAIAMIVTIFCGWAAIRLIEHYETPRARIAVDHLLVQSKWFYTRLLPSNEYQIMAHLEELEQFGQVNAPADPIPEPEPTIPEPEPTAAPEATRSYITYVDDGEYVHIESRRMARLRNALDAVADSPIVGHGIGFNWNAAILAHNMFLALWIDFGLFGLIPFIALLAVSLWKFYRVKYWPGIFFIGLVGLVSMVIHHLFALYTAFLIMGLMMFADTDDQSKADELSHQVSSA